MRTRALIKRIFQEMRRDKRTLALLFVAPLFILTLMYYLFNGNTIEPNLGVVNINQTMIKVIEKADIKVKEYNEGTKDTIINEKLDGLLQQKDNNLELTLLNSDPSTSKALQMKISQAIATLGKGNQNPQVAGVKPLTLDINYIYGSSETTFFDVLSPILISFFVFFFVFLISGIGLLRERTTGTLERLLSTPIRRHEVVLGYLVGYGTFAVIQTIIIVLYSINVLDIVLVGSIYNVILINLISALVALSLGILLSTFAASEFQMMQFIPIVVIPQIFFAGIFPLEGMANWLQGIAKIMPLYYSADALKGVMYKGWGLSDIWGNIIALMTFATIFIVLNVFALKKYRKL